MKSTTRISRRQFLTRSVACFGLALATSTAVAASPKLRKLKPVRIWQRSLRGKKGSKAAKRDCANLRFATPLAAEQHPLPHPGCRPKVVPLTVSQDEYFRLFFRKNARGGHSFVQVADLRKIK